MCDRQYTVSTPLHPVARPDTLGRMSTAPAFGRSARLTKSRHRPPARALPFRVFIGYSDLPAVRNATAVIGDAVRESSRKFEIHPLLWRFDQLASAHWSPKAVAAALHADVVVLTSSSPTALSSAIEQWISAFLAANRGRPTTLIAISGESEAWTISIEQPSRHENRASALPQLIAAPKRMTELVSR